jgi:hypothetical protein
MIELRSDFKAMDCVWVRRLNKVGVVHEVRRSARGEVDYYLVQVPVGDAGLVTVPTSPWDVKTGLATVLADRWDLEKGPENAVPFPTSLRRGCSAAVSRQQKTATGYNDAGLCYRRALEKQPS